MRKFSTLLVILVVTLAHGAGARTQRTISIIDLGGPPESWALAINNAGAVAGVGGFQTADMKALLLAGGGAMELPPLQGHVGSMAYGINNRGQVVGASLRADGTSEPVLWESGIPRALGVLPGSVSGLALDINERGDVVGVVQLYDMWIGEQRAVIWRHGRISDLGPEFVAASGGFSSAFAINNSGQVVGQMGGLSGAYIWQKGTWRLLGTLGGNGSLAFAVNDRGQVVGSSQTASDEHHAFLWDRGTMMDLGALPGGVHSAAYGINNRGEIVGQSEVDRWTSHAFLWRDGAMVDLGTLDDDFSRAEAINERGDIVGLGFDSSGEKRAVLWTRRPARR
jgi:probable HAF family extracellular repeat protein